MLDVRADDIEMIVRLLAALAAGAFIGYERSFHGRPAGLRTHVLVCLASSLLMLVTVYEDHWVRTPGRVAPRPHAHGPGHHDGHRLSRRRRHRQGRPQRARPHYRGLDLDHRRHRHPRRRRALPAHGRSRCCSTLSCSSVFRWIEMRVPTQAYYNFDVKYENDGNLSEEAHARARSSKLGFSIANFSYRLDGSGATHAPAQHDACAPRIAARPRGSRAGSRKTRRCSSSGYRPTGD